MLDRSRVRPSSADGIPWWEFGLRCLWIALQLAAAYFLANKVDPFFYQRF